MRQQLTIDRFKAKILKFLMLASAILLGVLIYLFYISCYQNFTLYQKKNDLYIQKTINYTINHSQNHYSNTIIRIADTLEIAKMVKLKEREKIWEILATKFEQLKEENSYIKTMHIVDEEGISFLRLHQKDIFGDDLKTFRPMIRVALQLKKPVYGYEAGKYGDVYRIMVPLFYEKEFVGLLGLGIENQYFLKKISELLDEKGFVFLDENLTSLNHIASSTDIKINSYILKASSTPLGQKEQDFLKSLSENYQFEESYYFQYEDKTYIFHATSIKNYLNQTIGYYIFQQNISTDIEQRTISVVKMTVIFLLFIFMMFFVLRYYILKFGEKVNDFYQLYEYAITGTKDGFWDWNLQTNEIFFNAEWKEMLGYQENELGNSLQTWEERVHPDDLEKAKIDIEKNILKETEYYENVHRLKHKNGSWVWIFDRGKTFFDKEGNPERMVGFHTDITPIKKLEEENLETKNRFESFMNNVPANIIIKSTDGEIVYANENAKKFFNDSLVGKTAKDFFANEELEYIENVEKETLKVGKTDIVEKVHNYKKEEFIYRTIEFLIPNKGKKQMGLVSLDITKEYMSHKMLRQKDEMMIAQSRNAAMGEMISMIAHQWRQPLAVISMGANNILADIELEIVNDESLKEIALEIIDQTTELSKIIDDFKEFFKPVKTTEVIYIEEVFDKVFKIIEKSLENNNIKIIKEYESKQVVEVYSRELMQVFINIFNNAKEILLEKNVEGKTITVSIRDIFGAVVVKIHDNGGGIPREVEERIFEPYFSTKKQKIGTGLGLYMSKIIIEKHLNGILEAYNENSGATFKITLPLHIGQSKLIEV